MTSLRLKRFFLDHDRFHLHGIETRDDEERYRRFMKKTSEGFEEEPLNDEEKEFLMSKGIEYAKMGNTKPTDTLAWLYQVGGGGPIEGMDFHIDPYFNEDYTHFKAWCITPFLWDDERIRFYEDGDFEIVTPPNERYSDIFVTNQRIIFFGKMYELVWKRDSYNIYMLAYPGMQTLPYHIGLDYLELDNIAVVDEDKMEIRIRATCEYVKARTDFIPAPLIEWNWDKIKIKSGELAFKITILESTSKTRTEEHAKALAISIRESMSIRRKERLGSDAGKFLLGKAKCENCGAVYRYQQKDIRPDETVECKNCKKPIS